MRSRSSSNVSTTSSSSDSAAITNTTIFVKLLNGETIPLTLPSNTTLSTLLHLISLRLSLPAPTFRLQHAGSHLLTHPTTIPLTSFLPPDATISVTLPLRGGAPPPNKNMKTRCTFKDCKEPAQRIVGDCSFCQGHFCGKHRMLEDHRCSGLEDCKKESHERNADKLNSERTMVVKGI
ncbi:MAG: hypothetical protein LQ350_003234 [Teloschistes chrysophthalmus]|nr:MAG: hypothetical protein LQ350_003234 [Niorma chrysophthalma]